MFLYDAQEAAGHCLGYSSLYIGANSPSNLKKKMSFSEPFQLRQIRSLGSAYDYSYHLSATQIRYISCGLLFTPPTPGHNPTPPFIATEYSVNSPQRLITSIVFHLLILNSTDFRCLTTSLLFPTPLSYLLMTVLRSQYVSRKFLAILCRPRN